ncbi:MAG: leucine-rich repeat domain-containing protein, partial [Anaerotignum sp.]|nr:leucine-rich repeat domain-containing protein [Anaerotignum sp.]
MKKLLCMMLAGMMMFPAAAYAADGEILAKAEDGKYDVSYDGAEDRKEYLLWVLDGVHETAADASFAEEDVLYIDQKTAEDGKVEFNDFLPMKETDSTVVLTGEDMEPQVLGLLEAAEASDVIAEGTHGDNLTWVLTGDGTLTISGEGDMKESYSASYYPWYAYQTQITKIVVNEGVTSIGDYAFLSCDKLNSVTLPDALEIIGEYAFEYCGVLKSIYIPESVETIGEFAFAYCDKLNTVTLPKSLTVLNRAVFYGCDNLSSVVFPAGLKEIGKQAFASCNLSSIELPEGLTTIGERAFRDCANLIRVKFPSTLEVVGTEAFEMCASLKDFSLPEGLKTIGGCAFNDCGSITKLEIPASVTSIAVDAFANCDGLQSISVNALNTVYDSRNNCNALIETATDTLVKGLATTVIPDDIRVIGDFAFNGLAIKDIVLPDGLTEIGAEAFAWCDELTFPEIPATVTSIGSEAFRGCDALESIEIPGSVTQIGNYAFADCGGLKKVVIAEGVKDINDAAFNDCDDVRVVVLPKSMETIRIAAFEDCIRIKQVYYYGTAAEWEDILISSDNDPLLNANRNYVTAGAEELIYASGTCGDNVTWKINIDGVMTISGTGAMADYYSSDSEPWNDAEDMIKSIIVENGVTTIGAGAFYYYEELESVTLPASVKMIGTQAFRGCYNLKSVTMSEGLESIGQYAFISCNDLKSIDLPKSLREIGTGAFKYCYALERIAIPDGVTEIRPEVFQFCRELKEVALPKSIQSIDRYAFYGCDALTDVYYAGTTAQWDRISIGTNNDDLLNATLYIGGVQVSGIVSRVYGLPRCDTAM